MSGYRGTPARTLEDAVHLLGGERIYRLYEHLVALGTTNLEAPSGGEVQKRHYTEAAESIRRFAVDAGFDAWIYDPTTDPDAVRPWTDPLPRPNVIIDHDVGARERLLVISHYDTVPVPDGQKPLWSSPPYELTFRGGRFYARGASDDIGSGVIPSLQALCEVRDAGISRVNIRVITVCDEETGGAGGLEAILRAHESAAAKGERGMLDGHLAFLPDASPEVVAGSSGIIFPDVVVERDVGLDAFLGLARGMQAFHEERVKVVSGYRVKDWPDGNAPSPHLTGRFTLTKFDWSGRRGDLTVSSVHAETDSHNTIPGVVTVRLKDRTGRLEAFLGALEGDIEISRTEDGWAIRVRGRGGHGGAPHRTVNALDLALPVLEKVCKVLSGVVGSGTMGFDMRLIPEEDLEDAQVALEQWFGSESARHIPDAVMLVPKARRKSGYAIPLDDPDLRLLMEGVRSIVGQEPRVIGEYGGTDASSFRGVCRPDGRPLRALMYGAIDDRAGAHDHDESADPVLIRRVTDLLVWMAANWRDHTPA